MLGTDRETMVPCRLQRLQVSINKIELNTEGFRVYLWVQVQSIKFYKQSCPRTEGIYRGIHSIFKRFCEQVDIAFKEIDSSLYFRDQRSLSSCRVVILRKQSRLFDVVCIDHEISIHWSVMLFCCDMRSWLNYLFLIRWLVIDASHDLNGVRDFKICETFYK